MVKGLQNERDKMR
jgi:BTK motif